jgi:hypothetical protein
MSNHEDEGTLEEDIAHRPLSFFFFIGFFSIVLAIH